MFPKRFAKRVLQDIFPRDVSREGLPKENSDPIHIPTEISKKTTRRDISKRDVQVRFPRHIHIFSGYITRRDLREIFPAEISKRDFRELSRFRDMSMRDFQEMIPGEFAKIYFQEIYSREFPKRGFQESFPRELFTISSQAMFPREMSEISYQERYP